MVRGNLRWARLSDQLPGRSMAFCQFSYVTGVTKLGLRDRLFCLWGPCGISIRSLQICCYGKTSRIPSDDDDRNYCLHCDHPFWAGLGQLDETCSQVKPLAGSHLALSKLEANSVCETYGKFVSF